MKKFIKKHWKVILGGLIVVGVISNIGNEVEPDNVTKTVSESGPVTVDDKVHDLFKKKHNVHNISVNENLGTDQEGDYVVVIEARDTNLFMSRNSVKEYSKLVYSIPEVSDFTYKVINEGIDSKGHSVDLNAYTGSISREIFESLNVDKLTPDQMEQHINESIHHVWKK